MPDLEKAFESTFSKDLEFDNDSIINLSDIGLGAILENTNIVDIPFISTAMSVYKIGKSVRDKNHIKKLAIFLSEIEKNIHNKEKTEKYKIKLMEKNKYREKELEFIIVILDRYIQYEKPKILARLYLSFLDDVISMESFSAYAATIEYLLPQDIQFLGEQKSITIQYNQINHSTARLIAFGLITETKNESAFISDNQGNLVVTSDSMKRSSKSEKEYDLTNFGKKLADIIKCKN